MVLKLCSPHGLLSPSVGAVKLQILQADIETPQLKSVWDADSQLQVSSAISTLDLQIAQCDSAAEKDRGFVSGAPSACPSHA